MTNQNKIISTQLIEDVVNKSPSDKVLIKDLVDAMDSVGFGFMVMIFSFCIIIPFPPPIPSVIAIPLLIISMQMILGYKAPKLPKRFSRRSIKRSTVEKFIKKSAPYITKVERVLKPRFPFMLSPGSERIIGVFIFIFAGCVLMPVFLSNFLPGLGILIMSFGLLGKDGLLLIIGICVGTIGAIISIFAVIFSVKVIIYMKEVIFGWF